MDKLIQALGDEVEDAEEGMPPDLPLPGTKICQYKTDH
jgi:hypothetical protein